MYYKPHANFRNIKTWKPGVWIEETRWKKNMPLPAIAMSLLKTRVKTTQAYYHLSVLFLYNLKDHLFCFWVTIFMLWYAPSLSYCLFTQTPHVHFDKFKTCLRNRTGRLKLLRYVVVWFYLHFYNEYKGQYYSTLKSSLKNLLKWLAAIGRTMNKTLKSKEIF